MNRPLIVSVFLILLLFPFGKKLVAQQNYTKLEQRLIKTIKEDSHIDLEFVPNILIYYQSDTTEGIIHLQTNQKYNQLIDPKKPIVIGDVSQAWTANEVLNLVKEGKLDVDADINSFLPKGYRQDTVITIESLLTHRSGLSKIPSNFGKYEVDNKQPFQYYTDTALLENYKEQDLSNRSGKYHYSLMGYALLQYLLKQKEVTLPSYSETLNQGYKEGQPITPFSYFNFVGAKGIVLTPNALYQFIMQLKASSSSYPHYPTGI